MYKEFAPLAQKLLEEQNIYINFVDIGSRNGILELADIAGRVHAFGFEPNPAEYKKLVENRTDAAKFGIRSPRYNSITYFPYAISDFDGSARLYVTKGPGAAGMREPNMEVLREISWKGGAFRKNFGDDIFEIEKTIDVPVKSLETFAREAKLEWIDYLKIDVEGSEYEVLAGAGDVLKNVGAVKVEVCFLPMRKGQKLFGEVDSLLRTHGLELLNYELNAQQVCFRKRRAPFSARGRFGLPEKYGQLIQSDAIYVNRGLHAKSRMIALGAVLLGKNYLDEALYWLGRADLDQTMPLLQLLKTYKGNWKHRLVNFLLK